MENIVQPNTIAMTDICVGCDIGHHCFGNLEWCLCHCKSDWPRFRKKRAKKLSMTLLFELELARRKAK
jgi:hypothetical protein